MRPWFSGKNSPVDAFWILDYGMQMVPAQCDVLGSIGNDKNSKKNLILVYFRWAMKQRKTWRLSAQQSATAEICDRTVLLRERRKWMEEIVKFVIFNCVFAKNPSILWLSSGFSTSLSPVLLCFLFEDWRNLEIKQFGKIIFKSNWSQLSKSIGLPVLDKNQQE